MQEKTGDSILSHDMTPPLRFLILRNVSIWTNFHPSTSPFPFRTSCSPIRGWVSPCISLVIPYQTLSLLWSAPVAWLLCLLPHTSFRTLLPTFLHSSGSPYLPMYPPPPYNPSSVLEICLSLISFSYWGFSPPHIPFLSLLWPELASSPFVPLPAICTFVVY